MWIYIYELFDTSGCWNQNIPGELGQYHDCWRLGSLRRRDISNHGIEYVRGTGSGGQINIKMSSYQYRKSHCGYKTILRPSHLRNGISYTDDIFILNQGPGLPGGKISTICAISVSRYDRECKIIFTFLEIYSAWQGSTHSFLGQPRSFFIQRRDILWQDLARSRICKILI